MHTCVAALAASATAREARVVPPVLTNHACPILVVVPTALAILAAAAAAAAATATAAATSPTPAHVPWVSRSAPVLDWGREGADVSGKYQAALPPAAARLLVAAAAVAVPPLQACRSCTLHNAGIEGQKCCTCFPRARAVPGGKGEGGAPRLRKRRGDGSRCVLCVDALNRQARLPRHAAPAPPAGAAR